MTELFREDGHLTDEGLRALVDGGLDELGRLEAAEHLSFCDACLVRYTALLEEGALQTPATDQTLPVMRRLRRRALQALASRYTAAAAAVLITGALWYTGVFANVAGIFAVAGGEFTPPAVSQSQRQEDAGSAILRAVSDWSEAVQSALRPAYQAPLPKSEAGRAGQGDAPAMVDASTQADDLPDPQSDPTSTQIKGVD